MRDQGVSEVWVFVIWAVIPITMTMAGVAVQWFRTQERLRLIEKGVPIPSAWPARAPRSPEERTARFRVAGIVCMAVGLGLLVFFAAMAATVPEFPKPVIAVSAVPIFLGLGFLIEHRIRLGEMEARKNSGAR